MSSPRRDAGIFVFRLRGADALQLPSCAGDDPRPSLEAFRRGVAAINGPDSNSGMNLFRATIARIAGGRPFFGAVLTTRLHRASLEAVADGRADLAVSTASALAF